MQWDDHEVVLRLAEYAAFSLGDSNDLERAAVDRYRLADRIHVRKETVLEVGAEKSDHKVLLVFDIAEEASDIHLHIGHHQRVGRDAHELNAVHQVAAMGDLGVAIG